MLNLFLGLCGITAISFLGIGYLCGFYDGRIFERKKAIIKVEADKANELQEILDKNHINYQKVWNLSEQVTFRVMGQEKRKSQ
jgi:hypothetical protein